MTPVNRNQQPEAKPPTPVYPCAECPSRSDWKVIALRFVTGLAPETRINLLILAATAFGVWYEITSLQPAREKQQLAHEIRLADQISDIQNSYLAQQAEIRANHALEMTALRTSFDGAISQFRAESDRQLTLLDRLIAKKQTQEPAPP
ncbi:MAG: hypothetical protein NT069_21370 [Planctomycetota bacterium]|nr:hypothetical protein [Planctomycetota bacterium]